MSHTANASVVQSRAWEITAFESFDSLKLSAPKQLDGKKLRSTEVLVKFKAASLNYRDLVIPKGMYPFPAKPGVAAGSDGAGVVVAVGAQVREFKVGDKVATVFNQDHQHGLIDPVGIQSGLGGVLDGTLREYGVLPETGLVHIPKGATWEEAATLSCAALTSWNSLFGLRQLKPGEYVLIQGTGGVSIFGLQFAKAAGAKVVCTTSSAAKAKTLKTLGADHVINYKETPEWGPLARSYTPDNTGFDHIIEVGGPNTLAQSLKCVKLEGIISMVGFVAGDKDKRNLGFMEILDNVCTIRGLLVGSRAQMKDMVRAMEANGIKPVVDKRVFKFEETKEAYQYMWDQKHFGKVVIRIDPEN
ncbi:putative zinc-containing alcohol dehydrogenase [Peziza echinospora]|nr:putative zinc-containing alcohol dehydrogenase [Peziza echinospora]